MHVAYPDDIRREVILRTSVARLGENEDVGISGVFSFRPMMDCSDSLNPAEIIVGDLDESLRQQQRHGASGSERRNSRILEVPIMQVYVHEFSDNDKLFYGIVREISFFVYVG